MSSELFREYCSRNQLPDDEINKNDIHWKVVNRFYTNPHLLALKTRDSYREVVLGTFSKQIARIDNVFFCHDGEVYIAEIKCTNKKGRGSSVQLRTAYNYVKERFSILPNCLDVICDRNGNLASKRLILPCSRDVFALIKD